jgi:hypothetical protein
MLKSLTTRVGALDSLYVSLGARPPIAMKRDFLPLNPGKGSPFVQMDYSQPPRPACQFAAKGAASLGLHETEWFRTHSEMDGHEAERPDG